MLSAVQYAEEVEAQGLSVYSAGLGERPWGRCLARSMMYVSFEYVRVLESWL